MKGYAATAQSMTDVAAIIERARIEGLDLAATLLIARTTLIYVSGHAPNVEQTRALELLDRHLVDFQTSQAAPNVK